jgi:hypothetical protein
MMTKLMGIDEFIASQSASVNMATIEPIDGKPDFVKVTPWTQMSGCLCHLALEVKKSSLDSLTPTGDTHICCGKTLKVVELHFKKSETLAIDDVFGQIQKSAAKLSSTHTAPQPDYAPGHGPGNDPQPPFNCAALSRSCAENCGSNICCSECEPFRRECMPWFLCEPITPRGWHPGS